MNNFSKLGKMSDENMDIRMAPLGNISAINIYGKNGFVTIGVPREVAQDLIDDKEYVGGLILANKSQYDDLVDDEHRKIFMEVFDAALNEMARVYASHREKKGDGWKKMTFWALTSLLEKEIDEYQETACLSSQEYNELLDLMNMGFMLLTRLAESRKET